jgi:hypothetical protein
MHNIDEELRKEFRKLNMRIIFEKRVSPEKLDALLKLYSKES